MKTKSRVGRASQIAAAITLGSFTAAASATPFSLEGVCRLTSTIAGQATCQLEYVLEDSFQTPTTVRLGLIKIDGLIVAQYNNDIANPVQLSTGLITGVAFVTCGVSHTVSAYEAPDPTTTYVRVGSLPPVKCPSVPLG